MSPSDFARLAVRRVFLASFLVLFLEVALIRWMPAHIRLLSYFSNFILLASLPRHRHRLPARPVARRGSSPGSRCSRRSSSPSSTSSSSRSTVPTSGDIFFSSGTAEKQVLVETTLLLPVLFVIVAALFVTLAQRMAREMSALPPLRAYTLNILGSLAGVVAFARDVVARAVADVVVRRGVRGRGAAARGASDRRSAGRDACAPPSTSAAARDVAGAWSTCWRAARSGRRTTGSPSQQQGADTVVEVNNIFHQSMAPVDQKEYFYQWPYMAFGEHVQERADPRRRLGHRRRRGAAPRRRARGRGRDRSGDHPARPRASSRPSLRRSARHRHQRRCAAFPADDDEEVRPRRVRADRLADAAIELLGRAARELHVHGGVVPRGAAITWRPTACW